MVLYCSTCKVEFAEVADFRSHHKSEWHIYNERRKAVNKPSISRDLFLRKLRIIEETRDTVDAKGTEHRKFRQASNHVKETRPEFITDDSEYHLTYSLFDTHKSETFNDNLEYMEKTFYFDVPDRKYLEKEFNDELSGLEALIYYLGIKIWQDNECIYCHKRFKGAYGVQVHMSTTGHQRVNMLDERMQDELSDFYDYSNSYMDMNFTKDEMSQIQLKMEETPDKEIDEIMAELGIIRVHLMDSGDLLLASGDVAKSKDNVKEYRASQVDVKAIVAAIPRVQQRMTHLKALQDATDPEARKVELRYVRQHLRLIQNELIKVQHKSHKLEKFTNTATTYLMNNTGH